MLPQAPPEGAPRTARRRTGLAVGLLGRFGNPARCRARGRLPAARPAESRRGAPWLTRHYAVVVADQHGTEAPIRTRGALRAGAARFLGVGGDADTASGARGLVARVAAMRGAGARPGGADDGAGAPEADDPADAPETADGSGDSTGVADEGGPGDRPGRPRRRGRRAALIAGGTAAVLAGLSATADVTLEHVARHRIAQAATCRLRPTGPVSAGLDGSFAGLRLITGEVGTVRISAGDVRRDGIGMSVAAELHDVTTKGATSGGWARATIGYGQLRTHLGSAAAGLAPGPDGSGGLVLTGTFAGIPLPVTVRTTLTTDAGTLTVTPVALSFFGQDIPLGKAATAPNASALARELGPRTVSLPALPRGVSLTGVKATGDGLVLSLTLARSDGSAHSYTSGACGH